MNVSFPARHQPGIVLEGHLIENDGPDCVVSHPHPLGGGNMDHPVVVALWKAAGEAGMRALRYNFRGVGQSTGSLTKDSPLALTDLGGAIDFLAPDSPVLAIGYSYGARCTLHALCAQERIARAALVALPTRLPASRAAFSSLLLGRPIRSEQYVEAQDIELAAQAAKPIHVFAGDRDHLVEIAELAERNVPLTVLPGLNHFFSRHLGNQAPEPEDLDALARNVLAFLRA